MVCRGGNSLLASPHAARNRTEIMRLFRLFETFLEPITLPPGPPPDGLGAFYWHHARQARGLVVALFTVGLIVALLDTTIPVFVGRVVTIVSNSNRAAALHDRWPQLLGMAAVLLVARPIAMLVEPDHQPGDHSELFQPDPLAEPLACRAPELDLLSERLCRTHCQPGHADQIGAA